MLVEFGKVIKHRTLVNFILKFGDGVGSESSTVVIWNCSHNIVSKFYCNSTYKVKTSVLRRCRWQIDVFIICCVLRARCYVCNYSQKLYRALDLFTTCFLRDTLKDFRSYLYYVNFGVCNVSYEHGWKIKSLVVVFKSFLSWRMYTYL